MANPQYTEEQLLRGIDKAKNNPAFSDEKKADVVDELNNQLEIVRLSGRTPAPQPAPTPSPTQTQPVGDNRGFFQAANDAAAQASMAFMTLNPGAAEMAVNSAIQATTSPDFRRNAPPMLATLMQSNPYTASALAITGTIGLLSSKLAGDTNSEAAGNAVLSAYPGAGKLSQSASALKSISEATIKEFLGLSSVNIVANNIKSLTEGKGFTTEGLNDWQDLAFSGGISLFSGPLRGFAQKNNYLAQTKQDVLKELSGYGEGITLGMMLPEYAAIEARVAQNNPELLKKIQQYGGSVTDRYLNLFGDIKHPADIATNLNQYTQKLNDEKNTLASLEQASLEAEAAAARASQTASPDMDTLQEVARNALVARINQQARVNFWQNTKDAVGGTMKSPANAMVEWVDGVKGVFKVRSNSAETAYKNTGVSLTDKFIPVSDLSQSVTRALSGRKGPQRDTILKTIKESGGKSGLISVNGMRELRANLDGAFTSTNEGQMDAFEAMANEAYHAITQRSQTVIEKQYGKAIGSEFKSVNSWWAKTANASYSKYLKPLTADEPSKTALTTLAADIAAGNTQGYSKFTELLDAIGQLAPDVKKEGRLLLHQTLRDGFLTNAAAGASDINWGKLTQSLNNAAFNGFPIESMGFGNRKQMAEVGQTFKDFSTRGEVLDGAALDAFYANPLVQAELVAGRSVKKLARKQAAKSAFESQVTSDALLQAAGVTAKSSADVAGKIAESNRLAAIAELSAAEQKVIVDNLSMNPMFSIWGRDAAGMPKQFGTATGQISEQLKRMRPVDVSDFMSAARQQNPSLAVDLEQRVVADYLNLSIGDTKTPGRIWQMSPDKMRQLFNPALEGDAGEAIRLVKNVVSPERFAQFKQSLPAFAKLSEYAKFGGANSLPTDALNALGITAGVARGQPTSSNVITNIFRKMDVMQQNQRYVLSSWLMSDKANAKMFFDAAGNIDEMLRKAPVQKALLLTYNKPLMQEIQDMNSAK